MRDEKGRFILDVPHTNRYQEIVEIFEVFSSEFPLGKTKIVVYFDGNWYTAFSHMYVLNEVEAPLYSNESGRSKEEALTKVIQTILEGLRGLEPSQHDRIRWFDPEVFE